MTNSTLKAPMKRKPTKRRSKHVTDLTRDLLVPVIYKGRQLTTNSK